MKTTVKMAIMSQLSDVQETLGVLIEHNRKRINFVKWLVITFPDTNIEIDIEKELEEYERKYKP